MLKFLLTMEHLNFLSKIYKESTWLVGGSNSHGHPYP